MIDRASKEDIIWLAGLLEGEGCFDLQRGKHPRVRLTMVDRDVVGRAATLFGSSIRLTLRRAPKSPTFHAEKQGAPAVDIMEAVLPHMGARRSAKIAEVLSEYRLSTSKEGKGSAYGRPLTRPPGIVSPAPAKIVTSINVPSFGVQALEVAREIERQVAVHRMSNSRA